MFCRERRARPDKVVGQDRLGIWGTESGRDHNFMVGAEKDKKTKRGGKGGNKKIGNWWE